MSMYKQDRGTAGGSQSCRGNCVFLSGSSWMSGPERGKRWRTGDPRDGAAPPLLTDPNSEG